MTRRQRVMEYIESGKQEGATLHLGGGRHGTEGYFIEPTIFTDVKPEMRIVSEEIFGPVVVISKFEDEDGMPFSFTVLDVCALLRSAPSFFRGRGAGKRHNLRPGRGCFHAGHLARVERHEEASSRHRLGKPLLQGAP